MAYEYVESLQVDRVDPPVKTTGLVNIDFNELSLWEAGNIRVTVN